MPIDYRSIKNELFPGLASVCAKSAGVTSAPPPPSPELQALYQQYALTRKAIDDNLYKSAYQQGLPETQAETQAAARYDQTPPSEPCQSKEPEDPLVARFKGLILDREEK